MTANTVPWVPEPQILLYFGTGTQGTNTVACEQTLVTGVTFLSSPVTKVCMQATNTAAFMFLDV